ncbi:aldolase [Sphingomonas gilva]|uniref:Aldolase n=1 Tax=Sphingomonas gilva TaxID=2305907 RepID=A0A396RJQ7_9SPHN|nr:HPr kinase/phosphatase C-terminal domain-containing protein [Sphingomonas gilva]RHW16414.1 aldolase [Sphingomonas gilva]
MMSTLSSETLHASCVAIGDRAVLIEGRSGAGKSDLALRLIDRGARLVSDDYVILTRRDGALWATAPANIAGMIEVRGLGIVPMEALKEARVGLVVQLADNPERMPEPRGARWIAGVELPEMALPSLEASAPIKIEIALRRHGG